jgi:succinate-acetate transporter protein
MLPDLIPTAAQLTDGVALAVAAVLSFGGLWDVCKLLTGLPRLTFCDSLRIINTDWGRLIASELIMLALFLLIVGLRDRDDRILFTGFALAGLDWHLWAKTTVPSMMKLFKD